MADVAELEKKIDEFEETYNKRFYISVLGIIAALLCVSLVWWQTNARDKAILDAMKRLQEDIKTVGGEANPDGGSEESSDSN